MLELQRQVGNNTTRRALSARVETQASKPRQPSRPVTIAARQRLPSVQRVLAHNAPLAAADIAGVVELKMGAVWRLDPTPGGAPVIIKSEAFSPNEGAAPYAARHEVTTEFAQPLPGAPQTTPLSAGDQLVLAGLAAAIPGGGIASLQVALAAGGNTSLFKAQHVAVGHSLGEVFNPHPGAPPIATAPYIAQLASPAVHQQFGQLAAFDLVLGNTDRFRLIAGAPEANLDNLDVTAAGPAAIDNVDMYTNIRNPGWAEQNWVATPANRVAFAALVVVYILGRANILPPMATVANLRASFAAGMDAEVATLMAGRYAYNLHAAVEPDANLREVKRIVATRLLLLS